MILHEYDKDLRYEDLPEPVAGPGQIKLKVKACGMCLTDLKIITGKLANFIKLPFVPGHEIAGEVAAVGSGVNNLRIGDRGVAYHILACGVCEFCLTGNTNLCVDIRRIGFEENGGYGEYIVMPAANLCTFGSGADYASMAVTTDAVATPYHALTEMVRLRAEQRLLIVGAGGLGLNAVQIARLMGVRVTVADVNQSAIDIALSLGAESAINTKEVADPLAAARKLTSGMGFDVVLEGVGIAATLAWSLNSLKKGGSCIIMGYDPVNPVPIRLIDIHNNQWHIVGTKATTLNSLKHSVSLVERGLVKPAILRVIAQTEVNQAIADLKNGGKGVGRTVITYQ